MFVEAIITTVIFVYLFNKWSYGYWKRRGVFTPEPHFFFGNTAKLFLSMETAHDFFTRMYEAGKVHKLVGMYSFYKPALVVKDPDLIKQVLVSDFSSFGDSGCDISTSVDPLIGNNVFILKGDVWKKARGMHVQMLTPVKIKDMVPIMSKVGHEMVKYINERSGQTLEVNDVCKFYTIDNISGCGFGLEPTAFTDKNNGFVQNANDKLFSPSASYALICCYFLPILHRLFSIRMTSKTAEDFFIKISTHVVNMRRKASKASFRHYLVDQLLKIDESNKTHNKEEFTDIEYASHLFTFYLDGAETSGTVFSYFLLELANHPEIQQKVREEVLSVGKEPEDLDYEKINSLKYLNMALQETLRFHPILPALSRTCTQDTILGGVNIEKGTKVFVPIISLQRDKNHYPEPNVFNPERFANISDNIVKGTFAPFGDGPRQCIGMRYAQVQIKLGVAYILQKFTIHPPNKNDATEIVTSDTSFSFVLSPGKGTKLQFKKL